MGSQTPILVDSEQFYLYVLVQLFFFVDYLGCEEKKNMIHKFVIEMIDTFVLLSSIRACRGDRKA